MNIYKNKLLYKNGQSLIEAVVAIAVVVLIVSGLIIAVISSVRSAQSSKARSTATKLTQDGIEVMRNLRDSGWRAFYEKNSSVPWCLWTDGNLTPPNESDLSCPQIVIGGIYFDRRVLLSDTSTDQVTITVDVTWMEGSTPEAVRR